MVKKFFEYKPRKVIVIIWRDAAAEPTGILFEDEFKGLMEQHTAGWYVSEDKEKVSLALDWCPSENTYRYVIHIPKVNIVRREFLKSRFTP